MPEKKKTLLRDLKIKSVSVVDQGANQHAHIQLAKRAENESEEKPADNDKAFFERIGQAVAKMFRITRKGDEVEKDAQTFEAIDDSRKVRDEVWRITDALQSSLFSIIGDEELTGAQKAEIRADPRSGKRVTGGHGAYFLPCPEAYRPRGGCSRLRR